MEILLIALPLLPAILTCFPLAVLSCLKLTADTEANGKEDSRIHAYKYFGFRAAEIEMFLIVLSVAEEISALFALWRGYETVMASQYIATGAVCLAIAAALYRRWVYDTRQHLLDLIDAMQGRILQLVGEDSEETEMVSAFILCTVEKGFSLYENDRFVRQVRRSLRPNDSDEVSAQKTLAVFCQMVEQRKRKFTPDGLQAYTRVANMVNKTEKG